MNKPIVVSISMLFILLSCQVQEELKLSDFPLKFVFNNSELGRTYFYKMKESGYDTIAQNTTLATYDATVRADYGIFYDNFYLKEIEFLSDTEVRVAIDEDPFSNNPLDEYITQYEYDGRFGSFKIGTEADGYINAFMSRDKSKLTFHGVMYTYNYYNPRLNRRELAPANITYYSNEFSTRQTILDSIRYENRSNLAPGDTILLLLPQAYLKR